MKKAMHEVNIIESGVCSPKGFRANGIHCGIRQNPGKKDLALVVSDCLCSAAGVYTQNKVKGAPIQVTKEHIANGYAKAIICNSGNANTCAPGGVDLARDVCRLAAGELGIDADDMVVCSTGVIGEKLDIEPFKRGIPEICAGLKYNGSEDAAKAIMTTDTIPKSVAVNFEIDGRTCTIGGIAKGSGMINPNMATMLSFITTDVAITPEMLQNALSEDILTSYNQICVDGDTSTNDTVIIMANGMAENAMIDEKNEDYTAFAEALSVVTTYLAKKLARDGEGATKLIQCTVCGAPDETTARAISKSVISSNLLKAAVFGADANWGRVMCAVGYCEGDFIVDNASVEMKSDAGSIIVCEGSAAREFDEEIALEILQEEEIEIVIDLHDGDAEGIAWGCDLTYDYVKINGEYRS